ncbi:bacteriocin [Ferrimonas kyonanensis]|uniref:bacteriocin n=1 Tax=Ferrimonas kyonanensis TaxID=364763 RepID=UPI0012EC6137|nr:bacteriocin [Ferrimonas kyonanensis]
MQELTNSELNNVVGGHPIIVVVGFVVRSTIFRNAVKGSITAFSAYAGYRAVGTLEF